MLKQKIGKLTETHLKAAIADRHHLHKHPELTWQEKATHEFIKDRLSQFPELKIKAPVGKYGLVAILEGSGGGGPTVGLRADMDALPVTEKTGLSYASCHEGVMHACGHDGHMATLLGAIRVLYDLRSELKGKVAFVFQPAEEGGGGADVMCREGALENPKVDVIYGLHGWPTIPLGKIGVRHGPMLASTCDFEVVVKGKGCHAAMPHLGQDALLTACRMVDSLQSVVSRSVAPTDPVVVTVGKIQGGSATNVISGEVKFAGTLRTVRKDTQTQAIATMKQMCEGIASAHGVTCDTDFRIGYPPTINHRAATDLLAALAGDVLGPEMVESLEAPSLGGEDFAYYLQKIPGSFFFLGVNDGRKGGYPGLHHPGYDFNDQAMTTGIRLFAHLAVEYHARAL